MSGHPPFPAPCHSHAPPPQDARTVGPGPLPAAPLPPLEELLQPPRPGAPLSEAGMLLAAAPNLLRMLNTGATDIAGARAGGRRAGAPLAPSPRPAAPGGCGSGSTAAAPRATADPAP
jgi:hypothetical protein